jgi:hypothetical protein
MGALRKKSEAFSISALGDPIFLSQRKKGPFVGQAMSKAQFNDLVVERL